ncbi:hypothetical protein [Prosthecodimorpha staleyi]|nr:hypothetical protein [Prosthecodimorpha staleyi]
MPKPISVPSPPAAVKVGRNDPYPCGPGKKFKKCCPGKDGATLPDFRVL